MEKSELKQIIREEIKNILKEETRQVVKGDSLRDDAKAFADDLVDKKISNFSQVTSTGPGSVGKVAIELSTDDKSWDVFKKDIERSYKKTGQTSAFSSEIYYSPAHKLYFFFYGTDKTNKTYKAQVDKTITWDYKLLVFRQIPKRFK